MDPERISAIAAHFPWLPRDYLRHLQRVTPGPHACRYGAQWFDGPQEAAAAFGVQVGRLFPEARLIGRRNGNFIGYTGWASGNPSLLEWRGSQSRKLAVFDDIAALTLSSILLPGSDGRPVAPLKLAVTGLALGPWHDAGTVYVTRGILLPDAESTLLGMLQEALPDGWNLSLVHADNDSWTSIRRAGGKLTLCLDRRGSAGTERAASEDEVRAAIVSCAPFNDGSHPACHLTLSIPPQGRRTT
ncbi:MAG: hypothetical protein AB7Q97_02955 [Gammaproteobacteria bacterium]